MMSADHEVDSRMSSPDDSDSELALNHATALCSPPNSQLPHPPPPTANSSAPVRANANGKRPLNHISNSTDHEGSTDEGDPSTSTTSALLEDEDAATATMTMGGTAPPAHDFPPQTHAASGYTWNRVEDEPGYAWTNKKAVDECNRAWDMLTHRDHMVKGESCAVEWKGVECADIVVG